MKDTSTCVVNSLSLTVKTPFSIWASHKGDLVRECTQDCRSQIQMTTLYVTQWLMYPAFMPVWTRYSASAASAGEVCRWKKHLEGLLWERWDGNSDYWYLIRVHKDKHRPPITLPKSTYAVLSVTRRFKGKTAFYSLETLALKSKNMLFPLKRGGIETEKAGLTPWDM